MIEHKPATTGNRNHRASDFRSHSVKTPAAVCLLAEGAVVRGDQRDGVSMYDPEAPTGSGFAHWLVADVPASATSLPANAGTPGSTTLPAGSLQLNGDAGAARYIGGAPPAAWPAGA